MAFLCQGCLPFFLLGTFHLGKKDIFIHDLCEMHINFVEFPVALHLDIEELLHHTGLEGYR